MRPGLYLSRGSFLEDDQVGTSVLGQEQLPVQRKNRNDWPLPISALPEIFRGEGESPVLLAAHLLPRKSFAAEATTLLSKGPINGMKRPTRTCFFGVNGNPLGAETRMPSRPPRHPPTPLSSVPVYPSGINKKGNPLLWVRNSTVTEEFLEDAESSPYRPLRVLSFMRCLG